ncbi:MAG TPA: glycoside hydrolase family 16 protein [Clostridiales bacterium]|jgi:beta-glucanase (GH16 family)|nr:glycoside hydrolase family 16 protein [Clostridiales bacterium]
MELLEKIFAPRQIRALKTLLAALLIIAEMLGVAIFDLAQTPRGQELNLTGYELVFEDEFEGESLDLTKWAYRGNGPRRAAYMSPGQAFLENGNLVIRAEYRDGEYGEAWYAGMIRTVEDFTSGYFECRCIASKGGGFWSAFWLNSPGMSSAEASNGGIGGAEIDIFEAFNYKKRFMENSVSLNIHVGGYGDGLRSEGLGNFKVKNPYTQYNTYGLEWTENEYIFYINGVEAIRSDFKDGVSKGLEYVILSLEPDGEVTENPGFSTDFIVDYVRVYQKPGQ